MFSMPELPEVETLRRELSEVLTGRKIKKVAVLTPKTISPLTVQRFTTRLRGQKITAVERRAKILLISFFPRPITLAIHLKMTGQLVFYSQGSTLKPAKVEPLIVGGHPQPLPQGLSLAGSKDSPFNYTRVSFNFTDGSRLYFNDLRKFGWLRLLDHQSVTKLHERHGLEPLSPNFTLQTFHQILGRYPKRILKALLLDQTLIAGLGNIYVDESCFFAKLKPARKIKTLSDLEIEKFYHAIKIILKLAIKHGGTSAKDYVRSDGSRGGFAAYLKVYGRAKHPCRVCKTLISKIRLASRGTHFCPKCQT